MKSSNFICLTLIVLMSCLLVITQSCVVYNKVPVNLDQAVEASTKSINFSKSKLYYKSGDTQKCFKVLKKQDHYYCNKRKKKMLRLDYSNTIIDKDQVDYVKTQDKTSSIIVGATVGVVCGAGFLYLLGQLFVDAAFDAAFE